MEMRHWINAVQEGDCLEWLPLVPDKSIDMILCDLPYGMTENPWDKIIDFVGLWNEYKRIIKDKGVIALTSQGSFTGKLILSNEPWFKYKLVWIKSDPTNFLNAKIQTLRRHEDICIFYNRRPVYHPQMTKGKPYDKGSDSDKQTGSYGTYQARRRKNWSGIRYPNDVLFINEEPVDWAYFPTAKSKGPVYHPTQKPVALGRYLIRTYSDPGAIILDNACGSGSFLVAAVLERRQFVGMELNAHAFQFKIRPVNFVEIARKRVEEAVQVIRDEDSHLKLF